MSSRLGVMHQGGPPLAKGVRETPCWNNTWTLEGKVYRKPRLIKRYYTSILLDHMLVWLSQSPIVKILNLMLPYAHTVKFCIEMYSLIQTRVWVRHLFIWFSKLKDSFLVWKPSLQGLVWENDFSFFPVIIKREYNFLYLLSEAKLCQVEFWVGYLRDIVCSFPQVLFILALEQQNFQTVSELVFTNYHIFISQVVL